MGTVVEHDTSYAPEPRPVGLVSWGKYQEVVQVCHQVTAPLAQGMSDFWGQPVTLRFFSASPKPLAFWWNDDFYVSQLSLNAEESAQLRLSDTACSAWLESVLGPASDAGPFRFNRLTGFEASLLMSFSKSIFSTLVQGLIKKRRQMRPSPLLHLVWLVSLPDTPGETGKLVLSLPLNALRRPTATAAPVPDAEVKALPGDVATLPEALFYEAHAPVVIGVGKTLIRLEELRALEPEDVVILEDSHPSRMAWRDPESAAALPFTARIQNPAALAAPEEFAMLENPSPSENLWNNLQIEVHAEFLPVRMPLSQLKQMTEGLVVEVGDLVHNQVRLHVEGKTVAVGELMIVGDKFGVRIQRLDTATSPATTAAGLPRVQVNPATPPMATATGSPPPLLPPEGEEAQLDDFLNQDFDAMNPLDEEEWS